MSLSDDIRSRVDIVELVGEYVPLQKAGRNFKALCPFHQERTPSFYLFPDSQRWQCFGACAQGGDIFTFTMKKENLAFAEALKALARRAGVTIPERRVQETQKGLLEANEAAASFFHSYLLSSQGKEALAYLHRRGMRDDTIEAFRLGLSPSDGEALRLRLAGQGFPLDILLNAGLAHTRGDGRSSDLFRGRLMFPIRDASGRLCGFGGRSLDGSEPKYLNTPRTAVFDKGGILYALDRAREAIRSSGVGVIVEGYFDAIAAHQEGFTNTVASMGTALTERQVALLKGLGGALSQSKGHTFLLALDPDAAGEEATRRSLESSWRAFERHKGPRAQQSPALKVVSLPQGQDPDEVVLKSPEGWRALLGGAASFVDYAFEDVARRTDLTTPQGKAAAIERLWPLVESPSDPLAQDSYIDRLARLVGVTRERLLASVRSLPALARSRPARSPEVSASTLAREGHDPLEEFMLAILLQYPELMEGSLGLRAEHFTQPESRDMFTLWLESGKITMIGESVGDAQAPIRENLRSMELHLKGPEERRNALRGCVRRLEERRLRALKEREVELLAQASSLEEAALLEEAAARTNLQLRDLFYPKRLSPS